MSKISICPFCKITLKDLLYEHVKTQAHKEALKLAGIDPSADPVIDVVEKLEKPEEDEFHTPTIPEPSKEKYQIKLDSASLSIDVANNLKEFDNQNSKGVIVNCARCNQIFTIPVPKQIILNSELPVVAISYIHNNKEGSDQHSITIYLDHDFDIRRQRYSDVIIAK